MVDSLLTLAIAAAASVCYLTILVICVNFFISLCLRLWNCVDSVVY